MDSRVRLNINTRFTRGTPGAYGVSYLQGGEMSLRSGLALAIANQYGPLQLAIEGGSLREVDDWIAKAQRSCQGFWDAARQQAQINCSVFEPIGNREIGEQSHEDLIELGDEEL